MRRPKPVAVMARANRNAVKISHTVALLNPERTLVPGSVLVNTRIVIASNTLTPMTTG